MYISMSAANSICAHLLQWFPSAGPVPAVFWQEINTGGGRGSVLIICTFTITINNQSQDLNLYL